MIIICEGVDGAGKSSAATLLVDQLGQLGYNAKYCREPGGTKLGEALRPLLLDKDLAMCSLAQTMLFMSSRFQLLTEMLPALDAGTILVFDRFTASTVAYQVYGNGAPKHLVATLNQMVGSLIRSGPEDSPMRAVFAFNLKVPPEVARERLMQTGKVPDRFEDREGEFQARVRQAYEDLEDPFVASAFNIEALEPINAAQPLTRVVTAILDATLPARLKHPMELRDVHR